MRTKHTQEGAWLLYISIKHDNILADYGKFTYKASTISNKVDNYVKTW